MSTPTMTVTMLGTTGSGKSTYLYGMYGTMSAGQKNLPYMIRAENLDDDLVLDQTWRALRRKGEMPPPTAVGGYAEYAFVLSHGLTPLITIDWADYRGGALTSASGSAGDVDQLHERLMRSDSIYVVLDGARIGDWLADPNVTEDVRDDLRINRISTLIGKVVDTRRRHGRPAPSIVLLITKADVVREKNGKLGPALRRAAESLDDLVPAAYMPEVTTLICPVMLGNLGSAVGETIRPADLKPVGLHRPLLFSLMHFLTEGVDAHRDELRDIEAGRAAGGAELAALRGGLLNGYFRRGRIADQERINQDFDERITETTDAVRRDADRIEQLREALDGQYIITKGEVTR